MFRFKIKVLFSIGLISAITFALDTAPVFILDDGLLDGIVKTQTNPLVLTSTEEFESTVNYAQKSAYCLLFFIEEEFSFEDISSKDEKGTPYFHLKKAFLDKRVKMLPRVYEPYNFLKNRFQPFDFNTFHVRRTTTKLRLEENYKFMYIFFEDGTNETRIQKLRRHDVIIQEVMFAVRQMSKGPVVAFYTGKYNPVQLESAQSPVTPMSRRPTPTSAGSTIVALCGNASFEFVDALMQHVGDMPPSTIKVDKCDYLSGGTNDWAYAITFEDLTNDDTNSPFYELRFFFTYHNPRMHRAGWKLNKVAYVSQRKGVLKTKWFDIMGGWDQYYESPRPLMMQPDLKFTNMPTLDIKSYRIYLSNKELMPPIPSPTRSTTKATTTSTARSTTKERFLHFSQDVRDEVAARGKNDVIFLVPKIFNFWPRKDTGGNSTKTDADADAKFLTIVLANCFSIVALLVSVLFFGIQMLMGISANSIYDSPDQPPLFTTDIGE